ncbi:unnamed protein product [Darwinula stevensoni]|uniref:HP domain-containing protein n=1 Tax=Darwinula stevensoni TaxID=69355 RepID=A0A7R9AI66_9CRUS|nr:unnamed protein product [Darwinula stevensoni]CAG0906116.1 unnamed protein product [Darwinula stevensoni]
MVDDGSGQKEVWRVENFNLAPVEPQMHGRFYGGDCYVVLYAYTTGAADHFIVYYWIGAKSSQDEQGTAALKAVEVDDKLGGKAVQVRVVQGKEPPHFMAIFGGKMIVYAGGKASAFDGPDAVDREVSEKYLLQVRGTSQYSTKAVEVDCRGASLNSNDVFLLKTPHSLFIWAGKGSTGDEREMAKKIAATTIPLEPTLVYEGQEKADFWNAIGGKEEYASEKRLSDRDDPHPARLFQCSNATGSFKGPDSVIRDVVETLRNDDLELSLEIVDFDQSDLIPDDVMLLDAWDTVFLWIGTDSNRIERSLAERAAQEYLAADPAQRDQDTPVVRVKQGFEPPNFTGFFGIWDRSLWSVSFPDSWYGAKFNSKTYEQLKKELQEENPGLEIITKENGLSEETTKYSLDVLLEKDPDKLPLGIDPTKKEDYLREEDFKRAFGMGMEDFETLPNWKRQQLKKSAGLF